VNRQTDRHAHHNTPHPYRDRETVSAIKPFKYAVDRIIFAQVDVGNVFTIVCMSVCLSTCLLAE